MVDQLVPTQMPFSLQPKAEVSALTRWQLTTEDLLLELEYDLRGQRYDENEKKWIEGSKQLLNEEGIRAIMSITRSRVNKITFLSNLDEFEINRICKYIHYDICILLASKWEDYEVEKAYLPLIVNKASDFIYIALKRAQDEGERKFLKEARKEIEKVVIGATEKGKGLLSLGG